MTGHAYEQSAEIAASMGPFKGYRDARCSGVPKPAQKDNVASMLGVIQLHRDAVEEIQPSAEFHYLKDRSPQMLGSRPRARQAGWLSQRPGHGARAHRHDRLPHGLRHTGVEPDIALVKYKLLAGGGMLKIVNRTVPEGLRRLGYSAKEVEAIIAHIEKFDTIEDVERKMAPRFAAA
jgi:ribonucleoside-diphosphate reductase alpha chain